MQRILGRRLRGRAGLFAGALGVLSLGAATHAGAFLYVDGDAASGGDGLSWEAPYQFIQDALVASESGDEIHVAAGLYRPDESAANPSGSGSRAATFHLVNGVKLMGGFAGFGEDDPDARDVGAHETILSGDLAGNDGPDFSGNGENAYTVVTGSDTDATTVLDGLTITAGNNVWTENGGGFYAASSTATVKDCRFVSNAAALSGGGVYVFGGGPTISNSTFENNVATHVGGGMYCRLGSATITGCDFIGNVVSGGSGSWSGGGGLYFSQGSHRVIECTFTENEAVGELGMLSGMGGGVLNFSGTDVTFAGCTFEGNIARGTHRYNGTGGGMYSRTSDVILTDSVFLDNTATSTYTGDIAGYGGGFYSTHGSLAVSNCTFARNSCISTGSTLGMGGGGGVGGSMDVTLTNSVFIDNSATVGGGGFVVYGAPDVTAVNCTFSGNTGGANGGAILAQNPGDSPFLRVYNSITWGNAPDEIGVLGVVTLKVEYCDVQGGWPGVGNIDEAPAFVDPDADDYRLSSGSPSIDAANNNKVPADVLDLDDDGDIVEPIPFDRDGNPRFVDDVATADTGLGAPPLVDMGAYEKQVELCPFDLDGSGDVGFTDLISVLAAWGPCEGCAQDFDMSGDVGFTDLLSVLAAWGSCP